MATLEGVAYRGPAVLTVGGTAHREAPAHFISTSGARGQLESSRGGSCRPVSPLAHRALRQPLPLSSHPQHHTPIHTDPTMLAVSSWCCTCAQQPQFHFSNKNYCPLPHKCVYLPRTAAEISFGDWDQPLQAGPSSQGSKEQRQHPSTASTQSRQLCSGGLQSPRKSGQRPRHTHPQVSLCFPQTAPSA